MSDISVHFVAYARSMDFPGLVKGYIKDKLAGAQADAFDKLQRRLC